MTGNNAEAWNAYWQKARQAEFTHKETEHTVIEQFWQQFFSRQFTQKKPRVMLELACGKGAVSEIAQHCLTEARTTKDDGPSDNESVIHYCLDYSLAAVQTSCEKPGITSGIVADANRLPLNPHCADVVFSQFGIEYAGAQAIVEAAEMVGPKGTFAAIIHHKDGLIYQHAQHSVTALEQVLNSHIFTLARQAFTAGFAMTQGNGNYDTFRQADQALSIPVKQITGLLRQQGPAVADGIILQFYRDLAEMFNRMQAYDAKDVFNWLEHTEQEFALHLNRMQSMLDAALDKDDMARLCQQFEAHPLNVQNCTHISNAQGILGWILVLQK